MKVFSYWVFPIISGVAWLVTLLTMFIYWKATNKNFPSQHGDIPYISDIGASRLKPLFIVGAVLTTVFLDAAFISDRLLRHKGRLVPNTSLGEKVLSGLSLIFAAVGTVGLTFLSGFDVAHYQTLHDSFLVLFIGGYLFSAIFLCWEFQKLGKKYRQHRILRASFWVKLAFIIVEVALVVAFVVFSYKKDYNHAAIFEWTISLVFTFYVMSFIIDLWPAVATKQGGRYDLRPMNTNDIETALREGHFATAAELALPRHTADSDRTLTDGTNPQVLPAAAGAAPLNEKSNGKSKKGRKTHVNF
ncbi:hypothetical protein GGR57DRAFT_467488 [Xylariaceae sp. FL1272]|nr:hypothetical protein GGR57DRAFT_467488 [Xylariaceae sp. FL1272]